MKYVANLLVTIHNMAPAEAMVLGIKSGLHPQMVYDLIRAGVGSSRVFRGARADDGRGRLCEKPT
jgi:L-threonate 2-dehydrogenase